MSIVEVGARSHSIVVRGHRGPSSSLARWRRRRGNDIKCGIGPSRRETHRCESAIPEQTHYDRDTGSRTRGYAAAGRVARRAAGCRHHHSCTPARSLCRAVELVRNVSVEHKGLGRSHPRRARLGNVRRRGCRRLDFVARGRPRLSKPTFRQLEPRRTAHRIRGGDWNTSGRTCKCSSAVRRCRCPSDDATRARSLRHVLSAAV